MSNTIIVDKGLAAQANEDEVYKELNGGGQECQCDTDGKYGPRRVMEQ